MRPNYAQDPPPTSIEVGGTFYNVETDFLVWIDVLRQLRRLRFDDDSAAGRKRAAEAFVELQITVFGGVLGDEDPYEALAAITEFSKGYPAAPVGEMSGAGGPTYSFEWDLNEIIIAIRNQHGVDLSYRRTEPCHWWEFLLLFRTLAGDHYILNLMDTRGYRGKDKEMLRRKYACALPPERTEEEQAELDEFNAQFSAWEDENDPH